VPLLFAGVGVSGVPKPPVSGLLHAPIHLSAWKVYSPKFALTAFSRKLLISALNPKDMGMMGSTMEKTLSSQAIDWREGRRLRAFELKERGWKQTEIADALGVSEGAVSQWMKRATEEGVEGLKHKPPPGAAPRLSEEQRAKLAELLAHHDAETYGFRGKVWTCERVAELIHREFGVRYHPAHVSRLLRALGFSLQKPARRADQRDEEAIEHWKEDRWPELKKGL
jgi:transposase